MTVLLIGGPHDGKFIEFTGGNRLMFPIAQLVRWYHEEGTLHETFSPLQYHVYGPPRLSHPDRRPDSYALQYRGIE